MTNPAENSPAAEADSHPDDTSEDEADVSSMEREIDELAYALYALTLEEIIAVEGAQK
jgi:hypothetical protein